MRNNVLNLYLKEIEKIPPLSTEEEQKLFEKIKLGDRKARERLILRHLRSVVKIAKLYYRRGIPLDDLINEGNLGLLRALKTYDLSRGVKFISYASWWIKQRILNIIYKQSKTVKIPVQKFAKRKIIIKIEEELTQKLGRLPKTEEIARVIGVSPHEIAQSMEIAQSDFSLDASMGDSEVSLLDFIKANPEQLEDYIIKELLEGELWEELKKLEEREKMIITLYFGLNGNRHHTLTEIGEILELSRERVRQIKEKSLIKLKARAG
ncbi:RNA polymerase sigma factor RpoD/SigA [candidate division WOR-3 bacterium]|nr:RNA polymerase sigma factor RpoD/SigA [candidate division WOR-3 bacterium]